MGVGTMKMIGGSYNKGHVIYSTYDNTIKITPESLFSFSDKKFTFSDVVHFEEINVSTTSGLAKAGTGAAAGYLLAGPLAGLAGMAIAGAGGTSNKFTLGLEFNNGDAIMVVVSPTEFMELKSLFGSRSKHSQIPSIKTKKIPTAKTKKTSNSKKEKKLTDDNEAKMLTISSNKTNPDVLTIIKGRKNKARTAKSPLAKKLNKLGGGENHDADIVTIFNRDLYLKIDAIHNCKWQYFDEPFNDEEIGLAVILLIISYIKISEIEIKPDRWSKEQYDYHTEQVSYWEKEQGFFDKHAKDTLKYHQEEKKHYKEQIDVIYKRDKNYHEKIIKHLKELKKEALKYIGQRELDEGIKKYIDRGYVVENSYEFDDYRKQDDTLAKIIIEHFGENITQSKKSVAISKTNKTKKNENNNEIDDRLNKLKSLFDKNIISKEEYDTQRKNIISEI